MDNLVSIIVPAYNAEQFISRCIDSILVQSYTNFEIIIVDDGSKDNTWNIIKNYVCNNNRIKAVHQQNKGVGSARNAGLKEAEGEWIVFIDADDYIDIEFLNSLMPISDDVDMVICGSKYINRKGEYKISKVFNKEVPISNNGKYTLKQIYNYTNMYIWCGPVCKMFSRTIINNNSIEFPTDINFGEDSIFVAKYLFHIKNLQFVEAYFYNIVSNSDSLTAKMLSYNMLPSYLMIHELTLKFCEKHKIDDISSYERYYMDRLLFCVNSMRNVDKPAIYKNDRISCYKYIYQSPYKYLVQKQLPIGFNILGKLNLWSLLDFLIDKI